MRFVSLYYPLMMIEQGPADSVARFTWIEVLYLIIGSTFTYVSSLVITSILAFLLVSVPSQNQVKIFLLILTLVL